MTGLEMCSLSRDAFLSRFPGCGVGDILYEHLKQLMDANNNNDVNDTR